MDIIYPVTAISRDGNTRVLNNLAELRTFCRAHGAVGPEWTHYNCGPLARYRMDGHPMAWILRDDRGRPVDPRKDFDNDRFYDYGDRIVYYNYGGNRRASFAGRNDVHRAMELGLPIPGVHKRNRRKSKHRCYACRADNATCKLHDIIYDVDKNAEENDYEI